MTGEESTKCQRCEETEPGRKENNDRVEGDVYCLACRLVVDKAKALSKPDAQRAKVQSVGDQSWQAARNIEADIRRIAEQGLDGSERDTLICRQIAYLVCGELRFKAADTDHPEPDAPT